MTESAVDELLAALRTTPAGDDRFTADAPDWFGDRVFGGVVLAQGLHAACQTIDPGRVAHSMHAYFLGALGPEPSSFRPDAWLYADFHALISVGARSTIRGDFYDAAGRLCMSMAQELLVRPSPRRQPASRVRRFDQGRGTCADSTPRPRA
jgi:acyl-CoA thioesterase